MTSLLNHLWQSTLFAGVAGLLTLALRKNRAPARYWLWFAASCKFLFPFALLVTMGSHFEWRTASAAAPTTQFVAVMDDISQSFAPVAPAPVLAKEAPTASSGPTVLLIVWMCGFVVATLGWARQWRRVRAAIRSAS